MEGWQQNRILLSFNTKSYQRGIFFYFQLDSGPCTTHNGCQKSDKAENQKFRSQTKTNCKEHKLALCNITTTWLYVRKHSLTVWFHLEFLTTERDGLFWQFFSIKFLFNRFTLLKGIDQIVWEQRIDNRKIMWLEMWRVKQFNVIPGHCQIVVAAFPREKNVERSGMLSKDYP